MPISHNDESWHSYALPKGDTKYIYIYIYIYIYKNHVAHILSAADISIFQQKSVIFVISGN